MPDYAPPEPERLLLVARYLDGDSSPRYLLVRWPDWPHPALLSLARPGIHDSLDDAVASLLDARLRVETRGEIHVAQWRIPVRMAQPRFGLVSTGWLRPVAVQVAGEPQPDALLEGFDELTAADALAALTSDVERAVFREGVALF